MASRTAAPRRRPGSEAGDLIVEAGGKPITDADDLHAALASTLELPFEVKLVRGTDERTVQVGGGATASGRGLSRTMVAEPLPIAPPSTPTPTTDDDILDAYSVAVSTRPSG